MNNVKKEIVIITWFGEHGRKQSKYERIIKKVSLGRRIFCARRKSNCERKMNVYAKLDYVRDSKMHQGEGLPQSELHYVALEQKYNLEIFSFAQTLKK